MTSELFSSDILDKDKFWNEELMKVNESYLFGLAQMGGCRDEEKGIVVGHAYSIMEAKELDEFRLLKIRYVHHGFPRPLNIAGTTTFSSLNTPI